MGPGRPSTALQHQPAEQGWLTGRTQLQPHSLRGMAAPCMTAHTTGTISLNARQLWG